MKKQILVATLFSLISGFANAHPGHGLVSTYAGFMHPLTGLDHLLVMLAVGVWAAKLGGPARWQLPLTFIITMAFGALLGSIGLNFAGIETAIAASVMAMGVFLMLSLSMNKQAQLGIVALFALLHGMAHGVVINSQSNMAALAGMLMATVALHGIGYLMGAQRAAMFNLGNKLFAWLMLFVGSYLLVS